MREMVCFLDPSDHIIDRERFTLLGLDREFCKKLYLNMARARILDREVRLLGITGKPKDRKNPEGKQIKITLGIGTFGQEAAEVGSAMVLPQEVWSHNYGRAWGAFIGRGGSSKSVLDSFFGNPLESTIKEFLARKTFLHVVVGIQLSHAVGTAWAYQLMRGRNIPSVSYFGDGATSEGYFHEALNWAAIYRIPVIFFCENNQWAISTPVSLNTPPGIVLAERARGYGMHFEYIDGNDPFAVIWATQEALARGYGRGESTLIEAVTYRLGPHTTAAPEIIDIPKEVKDKAIKEDPLPRLQRFLLSEEARELLGMDWSLEKTQDQDLFEKLQEDPVEATMLLRDTHVELRLEDIGMFAMLDQEIRQATDAAHDDFLSLFSKGKGLVASTAAWHTTPVVDKHFQELAQRQLSFNEITGVPLRNAFALALCDMMRTDHEKRIIYLGQDVAEAGGVMRMTALHEDVIPQEPWVREVLPSWEKYISHKHLPLKRLFPDRILNTPLDERGAIGVGIGLSLNSECRMRPIIEMQFGEFVKIGFDQVEEWSRLRHIHIARIPTPGVIVLHTGGGDRISWHKENQAPIFFNNPALIIVWPSDPQDIYNMFWASVASDRLVIFLLHIDLYRIRMERLFRVPPAKPIEEFGIRVARRGTDITVTAYGRMVYECIAVAEKLEKDGISVEVLDLRVLAPLQREAIISSVAKTGRLVIVDEGPLRGNVGAEIAAICSEEIKVQEALLAPVRRLGSPPTLWPPSQYWPFYISQQEDIEAAVRETVGSD